MHPYATDSPERQKVVLCIGSISVGLAYAFHGIIHALNLQVPWWVDAPGVLAIAAGLYEIFDKWLWRIPLLRKFGIVKVPDLNGEWKVVGQTSWSQGQEYHGNARIRQTWTHISICLETEYSSSRSLTASLLINEPEGPTLSYEYRNDPRPNAPTTMHSHRGTAVLRLINDSRLEGEYYSG
jgi:hypothetical protein